MSDENALFKKRIIELANLCEKNGIARFTSFLTENESEAASIILAKEKVNINYSFYGGYENAERKVLGFFEENESVFPVKAVVFNYKSFSNKSISHRDFLGAVMNLGIKREVIGDIITSPDCGVIFCLEKNALLISELFKIGNTGVVSEITDPYKVILPEAEFMEIKGIISALRLDSVVSAAVGISREKAQVLINGGNVRIKGTNIFDNNKRLEENSSFTVKGFGKYMLSEVGGVTKKSRIHIKIKKFK